MTAQTVLATPSWPAQRPVAATPLQGWLGKGTMRLLCGAARDDAACIVELGSWLGRSATFLAGAYPHATIYCVDQWQGTTPTKAGTAAAPGLYESFLSHLWPHRNRIVPVREDTVAGMVSLALGGVKPDLVYVDADHSTAGCLRDLTAAHTLFPRASIVGDDWHWATVRAAVRQFCLLNGAGVVVDGTGYALQFHPSLKQRAWGRITQTRSAVQRLTTPRPEVSS